MAKEPAPVITHSMMAEGSFLPTTDYSLLRSVIGENFPDDDGPDRLVALSTKMPGIYATFLGRLIAGSSFKTAAFSIGIAAPTLMAWLQQGAADLADDMDTYCSRLLLDVQRAMALAVGDAEERVHRCNPTVWLSRGAARDFHRGQYWSEPAMSRDNPAPQLEENPTDPTPIRQLEYNAEEEIAEDNDDINTTLEEALQVLSNHQILQKPEFIQQANEQFQINKRGEDGQEKP